MFCFHKWEIVGFKIVATYDKYSGDLPIYNRTHFSMICEKCGTPKIKIIKGIWNNDKK